MRRSRLNAGTAGLARSRYLSRGRGMQPVANRLHPRSAARMAQEDDYRAAVAAAFRRDGDRCVAAVLVPEVACGGRLDPHHVISTDEWPAGRCDPTNIVALCRSHHRWIHQDNPAEALARGLRAHRRPS